MPFERKHCCKNAINSGGDFDTNQKNRLFSLHPLSILQKNQPNSKKGWLVSIVRNRALLFCSY